MNPDAIKFPCDLCGAKVQMGDHRYEGHVLAHYEMFLCSG
jgi:hypothetical protein